MPVTVVFKYAIGQRVRIYSPSGGTYLGAGVVTVQRVVREFGNFYDVRGVGGFCSTERERDLRRALAKKKKKTANKKQRRRP